MWCTNRSSALGKMGLRASKPAMLSLAMHSTCMRLPTSAGLCMIRRIALVQASAKVKDSRAAGSSRNSHVPPGAYCSAQPLSSLPADIAAQGTQLAANAAPKKEVSPPHAPVVPATTAAPQYALMSPNWEPLAGVSKQLAKLERQVAKAASSCAPLVITGDQGIDTLKLAATIHALGLTAEDSSHPLVVVDCSTAAGQMQAKQLLTNGSSSGSDCLLQHIEGGTLVLNNIHKAPWDLLVLADAAVHNITAKTAAQAGRASPGAQLQSCSTRLVLISQLPIGQLAELLAQPDLSGPQPDLSGPQPDLSGPASGPPAFSKASCIAVLPLRARASDIAPLALQAALPAAALRGYTAVQFTDAAVLQLTGYHFPGNELELQGLVQRAVMQHAPAAKRSTCSSSSKVCSGSWDQTPLASATAGSGNCNCNSTMGSCGGSTTSPGGAATLVLDASDFWAATQEADRLRVDIPELMPWLRPLMLDTGLWPQGMNKIMTWMFPLVVASLFLGPQDREQSAALTCFWAGWWPLVLMSFSVVGRAWCAVCPFMITGKQAQELVGRDDTPAAAPTPSAGAAAATATGCTGTAVTGTAHASVWDDVLEAMRYKWRRLLRFVRDNRGWQLRKWPDDTFAVWGNWFMVSAFAAILVWEEVWDLPNTAALSGWLLVLITSGALAFSVVFEKRLWCRHLCPIGGMNGLFAKLSMTEIRSRPGVCAAAACSRYCHKGRLVTGLPAVTGSMADEHHSLSLAQSMSSTGSRAAVAAGGEGDTKALQLPGCPMNTYPGMHVDNHDCVMCGNCLRSCPSGSAQWRLRPPGADLWRDHTAAWHELSLMYVLLGAVLLHRLPGLCAQLGLPQDVLLEQQGPHLAVSVLLLAAPGAAAWVWDKAARAATKWVDAKAESSSQSAEAATILSGGAVETGGGSAAGVEYLRLAYSLLPLVWAGSLAHYEQLFLTEQGLVLPRLAVSLGADPSAAWLSVLPVLGPAPDAVVSAAQGTTLLLGAVLSWVLAGKIGAVDVGAANAGKAVAHQRVMMLAVAAELWHLIV